MIPLFLTNAKPLRYAALRFDAKVYNFTTQGWDALPATGIPADANLQAMTSPFTVGPLTDQQIAQVPDVINGSGGIAFVTFTTEPGGALRQVDCINVINAIESPIRGGVAR